MSGSRSPAVTASLGIAMLTGSALPCAAAPDTPNPAVRSIPVLFSAPLPDVPGKRLRVVQLTLPPGGHTTPHRHPGSVYVYVVKGVARLGLEGQPVQVVHAGESFFEPQGALHTVGESASPTEPAVAIAVLIEPDDPPQAAEHQH